MAENKKSIIVGDLMLVYKPKVKDEVFSCVPRVTMGFWSTDDEFKFTLEEIIELRSQLNKVIIDLLFPKDEKPF